jgi:hypothetical protein
MDELWRLRDTGLRFPGKRAKVQEYILWRRVAGGLTAERQEMLLAGELGSIRAGRASVVTQQIDTFTEAGIKLKSGEELSADLVVTATGLELQPLGGLELRIDGKRIDLATTMIYKGMMYSDVPNLASAFGYTNASWTLKCDLTCGYVCRLLNHMEISGYSQCTPRLKDASITQQPWVDFSSGYIQRAVAKFPKQGSKRPWRLHQNYIKDIMMLRYGALEDGTLEFVGSRRSQAVNNAEIASRH